MYYGFEREEEARAQAADHTRAQEQHNLSA
jgi:hypothetical protein